MLLKLILFVLSLNQARPAAPQPAEAVDPAEWQCRTGAMVIPVGLNCDAPAAGRGVCVVGPVVDRACAVVRTARPSCGASPGCAVASVAPRMRLRLRGSPAATVRACDVAPLARLSHLAHLGGDHDDGDAEQESSHGWLGIQMGPVPKVLGTHLQLKDEYLMILNVVEGSPADEAGIQQFDVIVRVNGKDASGDGDNFSTIIRKFEVGSRQELTVIRGGEKRDVSVRIGKRPTQDASSIRYKYEVEPGQMQHDQAEARGWMLAPGGGEWQVLPFSKDNADWQAYAHAFGQGGGRAVIRDMQDGTRIEIRKEEDGSFQVSRRKREKGSTQTDATTYDSEEEFKKEDPEGHKIYKKWAHQQSEQFIGIPAPRADEMRRLAEQLRRQAAELRRDADRNGRARGWSAGGSRATLRFETDDDGRIKVFVRDGDQELVKTFKNSSQLEQERPDWFKKYQRLHGATKDNDREDDDDE